MMEVMKTDNIRERSIWMKKWLAARERQSVYFNILQELRLQDADNYRKYLRMNENTFTYLLEKIRPKITRKRTNMRSPISAEEQLAISLRYFATGETH